MSDEIKEVIVYSATTYNDDWDFPELFCDIPHWFKRHFAEIPIEYQQTATIELSTDYDGGDVELQISYSRPETKEEKEVRLEYRQRIIQQQENRERAQLAQLKKKYPEG